MNVFDNNRNDVFVIVPCYNEDQTVLETVLLQLLTSNYQVILVDDGSINKIQLPFSHAGLHIIRHAVNLGQGAALETGTGYALQKQANYILHFDADGQHQISDIPVLLQPLLENTADIVFGSRFLQAAKTPLPKKKKVLLQAARYVNYLFTGLLLTDAHNGLRALNKKAASEIHITENRMAHASEILVLVKKKRLRFREVPVQICYTDYAVQKGQSIWNSIRIFFDLLLHKLIP